MKTRAEQVAEDVEKVAELVASLQAEAKAYAASGDNIYRCKQLGIAAAQLSEFMRAIRGRKAVEDS